MPTNTLAALRGFQFTRAARLDGTPQGVLSVLELPSLMGLYAFVHARKVLYLGSAQSLRNRVGHWGRNPKPAMTELLASGASLSVWIRTGIWTTLDDINLDVTLSLEAHLIGLLQPPWNELWKGRRWCAERGLPPELR